MMIPSIFLPMSIIWPRTKDIGRPIICIYPSTTIISDVLFSNSVPFKPAVLKFRDTKYNECF